MCGRTACTLAPDDICRKCQFKDGKGRQFKPLWRDAPGGKQYYPSYNIAPGSHTPVMFSSKHCEQEIGEITPRVIQPMQWGLVPSWHKGAPSEKTYETNNCRAESMLQKRTYQVPLQRGRRCVVLADGFFEWKRTKENKQPYFIYFPQDTFQCKVEAGEPKPNVKTEMDALSGNKVELETKVKVEPGQIVQAEPDQSVKVEPSQNVKVEPEDEMEKKFSTGEEGEPATDKDYNDNSTAHRLLTMAGVFDVWHPPDGSDPLYSYSVITVESSSAMSWIHHRMPAMLTSEREIEEWLNFDKIPITKAASLIKPTDSLQLHPVSTVVNNSRNKTPDCIKPIDLSKPKSVSSTSLMNWLAKGSPNKQQNKSPNKSSPSAKRKVEKGGSSGMMMSWLSRASPVKKEEEPPDKRMKPD